MEEDLNEFRQVLARITVGATMSAELDGHPSFAKHEQSEAENSSNGYTRKILQTENGLFELDAPAQ